ncbi:uncharacterized protein LOC120264441 [Dioscorea cayenensis subsp. rotundata]|uniref:Uncharacterized protein LOC120264441 n=1 Tax=Dioscorea cayennensis subsp. rotundata TaxID=55577 RepID=A0AB40BL88_DIOCR|nr:uncharacterized protein LOC120264441 [Dioscorea cayenensis subsp. rotundata]
MAMSVNSIWDLSLSIKGGHGSRSSTCCNLHLKTMQATCKTDFVKAPSLPLFCSRSLQKNVRQRVVPLATESNNAALESSAETENTAADLELSSNVQPAINIAEESSPQLEKPTTKRVPLTAREKLRAARVLSKYNESKPAKVEPKNRVLDALRESNKGKRPGLPEAPSDLLDDKKRGLPKQGLTFNFPGGSDLWFIAFSFAFISSVMFATTYIVWKVGAIHFNEY